MKGISYAPGLGYREQPQRVRLWHAEPVMKTFALLFYTYNHVLRLRGRAELYRALGEGVLRL